MLRTACTLAAAVWLAPPLSAGPPPDAVVAADGSGNQRTIQEAVDKAPQTTTPDHPWVIAVKPGIYHEIVYIQREKHHVHLVGTGGGESKLTYGLHASMPGPDGRPIGTFRTPTLTVDADDFTIENLTVENSAGAVGQALALRADGDRLVFRNCNFRGHQDTVFLNRGRQFFDRCTVSGAVDFIFGGATAYFHDCRIECTGNGYITAASTPVDQPWGFVFRGCTITASAPEIRTWLGRPWRASAATVFLDTDMSPVVRPEGWNNWGKPEREKSARYAEAGSRGAGASPAARVHWAKRPGPDACAAMTPELVLGGPDRWHPAASR